MNLDHFLKLKEAYLGVNCAYIVAAQTDPQTNETYKLSVVIVKDDGSLTIRSILDPSKDDRIVAYNFG